LDDVFFVISPLALLKTVENAKSTAFSFAAETPAKEKKVNFPFSAVSAEKGKLSLPS
jgi:hypothetical protein